MKIIFEVEKEFLDNIKFLEKLEKIEINENSVIVKGESISKLRANSNIIFRLLKIYDNFRRFLSSL